jgi:hypothetical protein
MTPLWIALWWEQPVDVCAWVEFLSAYTPQIYVRNRQTLVFEIGRSQSLVDAAQLRDQIAVKAPELKDHCPPHVGESAMVAEALAYARFAEGQESNKNRNVNLNVKLNKNRLPVESLEYFLEPYREHAEALRPLTKMLVDLRLLGVHHLQGFMSLSEGEIGMRWGHWGKRLWWLVHGMIPVLEPTIETTEVIEELYEFPEEAPATQLEPLYFIGKQLLQHLHQRLVQKNLSARSVLVVLTGSTYEMDFCGSVEFQLSLPAFHHDVSLWLGLLRERLQSLAQQQKLPQLLESLQIRVEETLVWQGLQRNLLDPKREEREGMLLESLTKIESRLGRDKVFCAEPSESYRPEKSWKRQAASEWYKMISHGNRKTSSIREPMTQVYELLSQKPLRVFPEPERVMFKQKQILFKNQWQQCDVVWSEIVCGEFWKDPFERRYGVAHLPSGEKLWLFKEGEDYFLQGQFL